MSLAAKVGAGARVAQLAGYHVLDRLRPMRPAAPGEVPRSVTALSSDWLTGALCSGTPSARVEGFELSCTHEGTSSGRALTVRYDDAGAGLPTELFTKTTPDLKTKLFTGLTNLFVGEANFYNLIRPGLDIECPVGYHASYELKSCRSMIDTSAMTGRGRTRAQSVLPPAMSRLAVGGVVEPPSFEQAWTLYRQQTMHGLIFWLATLGASSLQPDLHPAERCLVNVELMATAAVDLDALDSLPV